jgi:hypothetical protein
MVHQLEVLLVCASHGLAACKDSVSESSLDASENWVRNGEAPVLVAVGVLHPTDQSPEVALVHAHTEIKGVGCRVWFEPEPLAKVYEANSPSLTAHLKLDIGLVFWVPPKLERGEKLERELMVAIALDAPESGSEPDPLRELDKRYIDPKGMQGLEVETASVGKLA